jgi:hypothetical protein
MDYIGNLCVMQQFNYEGMAVEPEVEAEEISMKDIISNKENQRLLRNIKIHDFAIQIIAHKTTNHERFNQHYRHLLKSCFNFLIKFCNSNQINQSLLHENIDLFLKDPDKCTQVAFLI